MKRSAPLDVNFLEVCEEADAGPALRFHLVEVFHAGEVGSGIGSSSISSLLADGVGDSEVVNAGNLHGLGALLGGSEEGQKGKQSEQEHSSHLFRFIKARLI